MSEKKWVGVSSAVPRLELLVTIVEGEKEPIETPVAEEGNLQTPIVTLGTEEGEGQNETEEERIAHFVAAIHGFRISVEVDDGDPDDSESFGLIKVREIKLEPAPKLNATQDHLVNLKLEPGKDMVLEGLEGSTEKLLGMVSVWGWKLKLVQLSPEIIGFQWVLQIDWEFKSLPSYFPGFTEGEAIVTKVDDKLKVEIAWPFSLTGKLNLHSPKWSGTRWRANLDFSTFGNVLDSAGDALNSSSFGLINVASIIEKVKQGGGEIDDYLYLVAGTTEPPPVEPPALGGTIGGTSTTGGNPTRGETTGESTTEGTTATEGTIGSRTAGVTPPSGNTDGNDPPPVGPPVPKPPPFVSKDFFSLEISTPDSVEIAEFAGMKLWLLGRAAFEMRFTFDEKYIDLEFFIRFGSVIPRLDGASAVEVIGLELTGPIIRKIEAIGSLVREAATLLPVDGIQELPEIKFRYEFDALDDIKVIPVGQLRIPTTWEDSPVSLPALNFLRDLPMGIPEEALEALKSVSLGGLDGSSPAVSLNITNATSEKVGEDIELKLEVDLGFTIFGEDILMKCYWTMALDLENLAFDVGREFRVDVLTNEIAFGGLKIIGLQNIESEWGEGGMVLKAQNLKAFYTGISEDGDTANGFELIVDNLLLDSGGLDLDAHMTGGTSKLNGIGDHFKGAGGAISIKRSEVEFAEIAATGPLPWMDNATGTLKIILGRGFVLTDVKAEFQLGLHTKTDWWIELGLERVNIDLDFQGAKPALLMKITGKIAFKPPSDAASSFLSYFNKIELEFNDLVLTKSFDSLPPGLKLKVDLSVPKKMEMFGVFGFELRSIGIGSGFEPGQAALDIGGQVFFSSGDTVNAEADFHGLQIGAPKKGEYLPRIGLERLDVNFSVKDTVEFFGSVSLVDTDDYKGFKGQGKLVINKSIAINVITEFARVRREEDNKMLRVWMVFAEVEGVDIPLVFGFYLRDVGIGFGWRKTLKILENPLLLLNGDSSGGKIAPHHPESWINDLKGEEANWTVVLSSWITYGVKKRNEPSPLVGDIIIAIKSDLTFLVSMRGWIFAELNDLKKNSLTKKPALKGIVYYSPRNKHILAAYIVDPSASAPKGLPPPIFSALVGDPFSFLFETRPGLFRLELGWPKQLSFPLGIYTGRVGVLFRQTSSSVTIGVSFEIAIDKKIQQSINLGIAQLSIRILVFIGIYGIILMRIGNRAAMYGMVGINALIIIELSLTVGFSIKIGWFKITISFTISFALNIALSARISFGISDAGFGMAGYASVALRIWKFNISASVSFVINQGALDEAYNRVFEGTSGLGEGDPETWKEIPLIPRNTVPLPELLMETPTWKAFYLQREENGEAFIYMMMLPIEDVWFSSPDAMVYEEGETLEDFYIQKSDYDYELVFSLENVELVSPDDSISYETESNKLTVRKAVPWNDELIELDESNKPIILGHLFFEPSFLKQEQRIIDRTIELHLPELIKDVRVRNESNDPTDHDTGMRPDVRSPKFKEDSLYDAVLETAFSNEKGCDLSWEQIAVAHTDWCEQMVLKPELMEFLFAEEHEDISKEKPEGQIASDHWKKKILGKLNIIKSSRSALIGRMLDQFRDFTLGVDSNTEVLEKAGLFLKFKIKDTGLPFHLKTESIKSYEDIAASDQLYKTVTGEGIQNNEIDQNESGIAFAQQGFDYRITDVLDFQDEQGIYFSWILECRDADNNVFNMTEVEASGISEDLIADNHFEYFDHYLIERINLSRNESNDKIYSKEVKPAFVPVLQDMGGGAMKFYMVVPRFEFSDLLTEPKDKEVKDELSETQKVEVGDDLLYRLVAVDIFGSRSQVTELIVERKSFATPPAPAKMRAAYHIEFNDDKPVENISFSIEESDEVPKWEGEIVYEVWTKSKTLFPGSYLGYGDTVSEFSDDESESKLTTDGLKLVGETNTLVLQIPENIIEKLPYGEAHSFYVRAVSKEGNASRLINSEVSVLITKEGSEKSKQLELPKLERIPPFSTEIIRWFSKEEIRFEIIPNEAPVYSGVSSDAVAYDKSVDPTLRQLLFRIAHSKSTDSEGIYLTGGYEIFIRDRDNTIGDRFENYQRMADLEVVPEFLFKSEPLNTDIATKWLSNYLRSKELSVDHYLSSNEEWVAHQDWGEAFPPQIPTDDETLIPDGVQIHPRLYDLLKLIEDQIKDEDYELTINGGLPTGDASKDYSFGKIQETFNEKDDPTGINLLKWMGRSVDFSLMKGIDSIKFMDLESIILGILTTPAEGDSSEPEFWNRYHPVLEIILAGDKSTQMNFYRLSLCPVVVCYRQEEESLDYKQQTFQNFEQVVGAYAASGRENTLPGIEDKVDEAMALLKRYLLIVPKEKTSPLQVGVTFMKDMGNLTRSIRQDGTILFGFTYAFEYARRFAYKIKQRSRYHYIYQEFEYFLGVQEENQSSPVQVRFPRVKKPRPPAVQYLGSRIRKGVIFSEWLLPEHEEESKVSKNETARNMLGFRGVAWSLFTKAKAGILEGSGWVGEVNWLNLENDQYQPLTTDEKSVLKSAPDWRAEKIIPPEAGLAGHPFEELLGPKGLIVRIPKLPYYYDYQMGAFARTDDVDSIVKLSDEAKAEPALIPSIAQENCGWYLSEGRKITLWWKVPSVWESLDDFEQTIWGNEEPLARRLWDFDLQYSIILSRNLTRISQLIVKAEAVGEAHKLDDLIARKFEVQTTGNKLFYEELGKVDDPRFFSFQSPFEPIIKIELDTDPFLIEAIKREEFFRFDLECFRLYGPNRKSATKMYKRTIK